MSENSPDPPPPVLGSWRALYLLVLGFLVVIVGLLAGLQAVYG